MTGEVSSTDALKSSWTQVHLQPQTEPEPTSALGHKETFALQNVMSALPPIATAKADLRKNAISALPRKRTCAVFIASLNG
jgi:hypothetical protein